jgi:uncharacterized protein (TIGR03083 family)
MTVDTVTKEQLLDNIRASERAFLDAAGAVPAGQWSEGRYEEGWTAKDILAHVASVEWTYPKLLDLAQMPKVERDAEKHFRGGTGGYNQRQVEKRAEASIDELIEEFRRNRKATIEAVEQADEELLRAQVRSAGGIEGTAAEVMNYLTVIHLNGHLDDIKGAS